MLKFQHWGLSLGVRDLFLTLGGWPSRGAGLETLPPPTLKGGEIFILGRKFGGAGEFIIKRIFNFKWIGEWHDSPA